MTRVIEGAFAEVQDFQRALRGRVDGEFVRLLGEKGVEVHAPTEDELGAWRRATASVYDETRSYLGGSRVADTLRFRRDWDAGRYARGGGPRGALRPRRRAGRGVAPEPPVIPRPPRARSGSRAAATAARR